MNTLPHPRLGVSSWSLHHGLTRGDFAITDLPKLCAEHGLGLLEVCDFHLASTDKTYLNDYRERCSDAGVTFFTLLKDSGDITNPAPAAREAEIEAVKRAIDVASELGAKRIRVIAGDAVPSKETLDLSANGLLELADYGTEHSVRVVIENWHLLLDSPADVLTLLELTKGKVGLKLDFGNWDSPRKYNDLPLITPKAESTHAKAQFSSDGVFDFEDFTRCMDICQDANFAGAHILIYDAGGDEWAQLDRIRDVVMEYVL